MTHPFPVKVQKRSLEYRRNGSDKEYHLLLITNASGEAIYVERYGKRGTWGQMNPMHGDKTHHTNQFAKKYGEKTKKGYEPTRDCGAVDVRDVWDLYQALEGYWHKIQPQLLAMFGQAQLDMVKGSKSDDLAKSSESLEETVAMPTVTEAERYAKNPLYGAF